MKKNKLLVFLFSLLFMLFATLSSVVQVNALINTSNVLTDLKVDENFNESDYPVNGNDWSIYVIQIGESSNKELYIYTYQPSNGTKDLLASSINISWSINENLSYKNYKLNFCNKSGVFNKYLVNGFVVKNDKLRYYDISEILRPFDSTFDTELDYDNPISEVGLEVGQLWTVTSINNTINYNMEKTDVLTINHKYCSYILYYNGWNLNNLLFFHENTSSHFLSFSTEFKIDKLFEAELFFVEKIRDFNYDPAYPQNSYDRIIATNTFNGYKINKYQKVASNDENIGSADFFYSRIQSKEEFLSNERDLLDSEAIAQIEQDEFVLRFYESDFTERSFPTRKFTRSEIDDIAILRLKFRTDGIDYNLGVVDSKQSSTKNPSGVDNGGLDDLWEIIKKILELLVLVIVIVLCWPLIIVIVPIITKLFKYTLKALIWVISFPFRIMKRKK